MCAKMCGEGPVRSRITRGFAVCGSTSLVSADSSIAATIGRDFLQCCFVAAGRGRGRREEAGGRERAVVVFWTCWIKLNHHGTLGQRTGQRGSTRSLALASTYTSIESNVRSPSWFFRGTQPRAYWQMPTTFPSMSNCPKGFIVVFTAPYHKRDIARTDPNRAATVELAPTQLKTPHAELRHASIFANTKNSEYTNQRPETASSKTTV